MTLATRISLFFLAALALVLLGFAASIYGLVSIHLSHQVNQHAIAALDALTSAMEFETDGLIWEPHERRLALGRVSGNIPIQWGVFDIDGLRVDGSAKTDLPLIQPGQPPAEADHEFKDATWQNETWRIAQRTIRADETSNIGGSSVPQTQEDVGKKRYSELIVAVGIPLQPVFAPLRTLAIALFGLLLVIWLSAALAGRWLGNKAIAPIARMAQTARSITAADLSRRLSATGSSDELEDLRHAFNDLLDRLQISLERQQRFAAEASHQLRTPLTAILGQLDVALRRDREPAEYRRVLDSIHGSAAQLSQIIEMLLFLAREDSEAFPPALERLEMRSWLAQHLLAWKQHPRYADIRAEFPSDGSVWLAAHGGLLGQAIDNLLENACKYSQPGSPIVVYGDRSNGKVVLTIEDHGYGIAPDELPHVFEPFFRSADARRRGLNGIGLGLAVVNRIISAFNGRVEVQSSLGQGSQFSVTLPELAHQIQSATQPQPV